MMYATYSEKGLLSFRRLKVKDRIDQFKTEEVKDEVEINSASSFLCISTKISCTYSETEHSRPVNNTKEVIKKVTEL